MSNRLATLWSLTIMTAGGHLRSPRTLAMVALLLLFIPGGSWGLSDPAASVTAQLSADTPYEILYLVSVFVLFSSTLGVVLLGFDGISRKRLTGELAIELSQPIPRFDLALSQLLGLWWAVFLPTMIASFLGVILIHVRMDDWPTSYELLLFLVSTALVILWYSGLQLLVSSVAKDFGTSITLGVGMWMGFTLIWLLITALLAAAMGVDVTDTLSEEYDSFTEMVDLFSPNGVYQLILESGLHADARPSVGSGAIGLSALLWTFVPSYLFVRRMASLRP